VTTLALVVGLVVAILWQPGAGMNVDPADRCQIDPAICGQSA